MFAMWTVFWVSFWFATMIVAPNITRSTLEEENRASSLAQLLTCQSRSIIVGLGSIVAADGEQLNHIGFAFFTYEIVDLVLGSWFRLHTRDMFLHHALHILAGWLIWSNKLGSLARPLMLQEMSSIFLNSFVFVRNRYPSVADACFACFALAFAVTRLGIGTATAARFFVAGTHPMLSILVCGGSAMQWRWGVKIMDKLRRQFQRKVD
jgi:hypothetical protein